MNNSMTVNSVDTGIVKVQDIGWEGDAVKVVIRVRPLNKRERKLSGVQGKVFVD